MRAESVPRSRYLLFFSIAVLGCAFDLVTKHYIFAWLGTPVAGVDNTWWLIEGHVGIQTAVNQGALFGMGQGLSVWFATLSIVAAIGVLVWLFHFKAAQDLLLTLALGSVLGGIFGNLYDRLGLWHGADVADAYRYGVRDWILLQYSDQWVWPNFNIADCMLVCGAGLLMLHAVVCPKQPVDVDEFSGNSARKEQAA